MAGFEIQAHRGNDPIALRRLLAAGPSSVEIDVGLGDSGLVVAHDFDLGDASTLTVDDVLATCGATRVVLDVKCCPPETPEATTFFDALRPYLDRVDIGSFDEHVVASVVRRKPDTATTFLFESPLRAATAARTLGPRFDLVTRDLVEAAHTIGIRVVPWTVNDPVTMAGLIDLEVDGLVTDVPELARKVASARTSGREAHRSVA